MLSLAISSVTLIIALYILVKGADIFIDGAKQLGSAAGMSKFAIGVFIVGMGTSLPELASSIAAVMQNSPVNDTTSVVLANVIGSNITNILLVVGLSALIGGTIAIKKDLIRSELPVFFIATTHFIAVVFDGVVDRIEAVLLLGTFGAYLWYLFKESQDEDSIKLVSQGRRPRITPKSLLKIIFGLIGLLVGAKYSIDMMISIGTGLSIPLSFISITVLAIGTSLPELFVELRAVMHKEHELGIGNIFGSNAFNMLLVVGLPGLLMPLRADDIVMQLGLPILVAASLIFFVNGLSRRIMQWEGIMMVIFFAFFVVKLVTFL